MGQQNNFKILSLIFLSILFVTHSGLTAEKRVTTPDGQVSVFQPEGFERGVPPKGYSLLLGFIEPGTKIRANFNLMITNIPGISEQKFTLDQLFASSKANLDKTFQSNYENLTKFIMTVMGKEILAIKYDIQQQNGNFTCKQYYVFSGDNRYLFTAVASQKNFSKYEGQFDSVVSSIQIKK